MTVIALPPPKKQEHYTMAAFDGADDDGGTLYVLYDESGRQITGSAWPQPLEAIAKLAGFSVRVSSYAPSDRSDCEVPGGRRPKLTLASHLMQQLPDDDVADAEGRDARFSRTDDGYEDPTDGERHEYDDVPPRCKVEGCDTPALIQKGPYGRLCAEHKEAKKRSLTKRKSRPKLIRASEIKPKSAPESTFVQLARRIELVKEQIAEMEAGLKELVDELVDAAHTRSTA